MAIAERSVVIAAARPRTDTLAPQRLIYLDSLKVLLTALVIAHHAGQPYGPTGGFWPIFDAQRAAILGPFFSVNAAFFMGLFFLISAYFLPQAADRKGIRQFLTDRAVRLGVPLVLVGVGLFGALGAPIAHLWFVEHLLIYAVLYAVWRELRLPAVRLPVPNSLAIAAYTLLLAAVTFVVRLEFPIDRWVDVFGVLRAEVGHLPQYASLFAIGLLAARGEWLERLPTRTGMVWLTIGLVAAALRYILPLHDDSLWCVWESVICVGMCVGLPVLFREYAVQGSLLRWAAPNAYAAYVIHMVPVVVGLQFALANAPLDPFAKFSIVTWLGIPLSFVLAAALRRLPGVRRVL
jgi:glucans biosynthesis protein C